MSDDDLELVREYALHNSQKAFETLVSRYANLVYSTALRQLDEPHAADDVLQVVFIILARKAGSLGPRTILSSWLYRTTCFAAADALKIQRRRVKREQEAYMESQLNQSEPDVWSKIAPLIDEAVAGLAEKDRHAIVLRYFENKSLAEVGSALNATEDAARVRLNRALEKLKKFFSKRNVTVSTLAIAKATSAQAIQPTPATSISCAMRAAEASSSSASALNMADTTLRSMVKAKVYLAAGYAAALLVMISTLLLGFHQKKSPAPSEPKTAKISFQVQSAVVPDAWLDKMKLQRGRGFGVQSSGPLSRSRMDQFRASLQQIPALQIYSTPQIGLLESQPIQIPSFAPANTLMGSLELLATARPITNTAMVSLSLNLNLSKPSPMQTSVSFVMPSDNTMLLLLTPGANSECVLLLLTATKSVAL